MSASKHMPPTPHGATVLVCDGRKSLLFQNAGSPAAPKLQLLEQHVAPANPPTHLQGVDRPGRADTGHGRRSAVGQTDFHDDAERAFAIETLGRLEDVVKTRDAEPVFIVAPPRTLAILLDHMSAKLRTMLVGDMAADLTKHTVADMEERLAWKDAR
jgi:protein required for attachment to host cells